MSTSKQKSKQSFQNLHTSFNKKNTMLNLIQVLFLLSILFIKRVSADLPVHCLHSDVVGFWTLRLSTRTFTPSLENEIQTSCGHGLPNKIVEIQDDSDLNIQDYKEINIELREDFRILEAGKDVGHWTFVYDQSFILYYKNAILTAPFRYYKRVGVKDVESNCSKTFLGWYIPDTSQVRSNWSCFYALKGNNAEQALKSFNFLQIDFNLSKEKKENSLDDFINNNIKTSFSFVQTNGKLGVQANLENKVNLENLIKYEQMTNVVDRLNKLDLGWTADVHKQYVGMSFAELKHNLGLNKGKYGKKGFFDENTSFIQLGNKNSANAAEDKKAEEDTVEDFFKSIDTQLNLISIEGETAKNQKLFSANNSSEDKETESDKNLSKSFLIASKNSNSNSKEIGNAEKDKDKDLNCCVPDPKNPTASSHEAEKPAESRYPYPSYSSNFSSSSLDKDSSEVHDYAEISKYLHTDISQIDENKLSKNWDWRNVGSVSFVPPVRSQGSCGSCYVFSTMTSLEARLRVQTNNQDQTLFSKQFPLSCNFYSEGCDGGYPVLVAKFLQEFEAVPESCFEYTEKTNKCSNACDYTSNKKKYTVSKWGYLGGAYGKTSEADIMKELRARGPIPGNILVHWSFSYYKNGIFSTKALKSNIKQISKFTLLDSGRTWAKVEHSITLVGYGEENGVKYWIGMNTWGANWGENGFFKILRGENESEIESMGDFMNIKVEDRH